MATPAPAGAPSSGPPALAMTSPDVRRLCDRCLGRRAIGAAGVAPQRAAGAKLRADAWPELPEASCAVCEGAFADAPRWLEASLAALVPYEFRTFQVGTKFPGACEGLEKAIAKAMGQEKVGETIRTEANRWLAFELAQATGAATSPERRPEVVLELDTRYWSATVEANSVFVRGRYNKFRRDIPQTHWPCRRCTGRGCWECNGTGVTYAESVEDAVGDAAKPLFGAGGYAFHGAGREDIDALMLGTGRPFILELKHPRRRTADLAELAARINAATATSGVAVRDLRMAAPDEVAAIKEGEYEKEYLAHCVAQAALPRDAVVAITQQITGKTLDQRTPERVSHRRADLVRKRTVHAMTVEQAEGDPVQRFSLRVRADSGTYIKELVSGDDGRTVPSFAQLAGVPVMVEFLDVVAILDDRPKVKPEGDA